MKSTSTLALCIPAYNAAKFLPLILTSANNQLIPFDEILVYNDCSTDNTLEVAEKYGATVINGVTNQGCSFGKNVLASISKSDWLHFHDADDDIFPNFTTVVHKWIDATVAPDVILLNFEYRDKIKNNLLSMPNYDIQMLRDDVIKFCITHKVVNFGIYKKSSFIRVGGFELNPLVLYNEDAAFHHKLALAGLTFDYEKKITCINYRYPQSMSASNAAKCHLSTFYVTENLLSKSLHLKYSTEIGDIYWSLATLFASVKNWKYCKKSIGQAIKLTGDRYPGNNTNVWFRMLSFSDPFFAFYFREKLIRLFKPHLRSS